MRGILRLIIFTIFYGSCVCNAYLYDIKVLRKWYGADKTYHYFIGCSDFHDRLNNTNEPQRKEVLRKLATMDKRSTQILVEDLSSANTSGLYGCNNYYLTSERGILAGLTRECQKCGVSVQNLEYRYSRVIALGSLLSDIDKNAFEMPTAATILVDEFLTEVMGTLQEIRRYSGNTRLLNWYKTHCYHAEQFIRKYQLEQMKDKSLAHYFEMHAPIYGRMAFLKQLLTFDSGLFDCKLLNAALEASDKKRVIAFAGGTHIERVTKQLERAGYQVVYSSSASSHKRHELRKCLGSSALFKSYSCTPPKPLEVDILTRYL